MKRLLPILFILAFAPALWGAIKVNPITSAEPGPMTNVVLGVTTVQTNTAWLLGKISTNDSRNLVLTGTSNNLGGAVSATTFWGDGSHLTGVTGGGATNAIANLNGLGTNTTIYSGLTSINSTTNKGVVYVGASGTNVIADAGSTINNIGGTNGVATANSFVARFGGGFNGLNTGLTNASGQTIAQAITGATNAGNIAFLTANSNFWGGTMRFGSNVYFDLSPTFTNAVFETSYWPFTNSILATESTGAQTNVTIGTGLSFDTDTFTLSATSTGSGHTNLLDSGDVLVVTNEATEAHLEVSGNQTNLGALTVVGTLTGGTITGTNITVAGGGYSNYIGGGLVVETNITSTYGQVAAPVMLLNSVGVADTNWVLQQISALGAYMYITGTTNSTLTFTNAGDSESRTNIWQGWVSLPTTTTTNTYAGLVANAYIRHVVSTNTYTLIEGGPVSVSSYVYRSGGAGTVSGHYEFYVLDTVSNLLYEIASSPAQIISATAPTLMRWDMTASTFVSTNTARFVVAFKMDQIGTGSPTLSFVNGGLYDAHANFVRPLSSATINGTQVSGPVASATTATFVTGNNAVLTNQTYATNLSGNITTNAFAGTPTPGLAVPIVQGTTTASVTYTNLGTAAFSATGAFDASGTASAATNGLKTDFVSENLIGAAVTNLFNNPAWINISGNATTATSATSATTATYVTGNNAALTNDINGSTVSASTSISAGGWVEVTGNQTNLADLQVDGTATFAEMEATLLTVDELSYADVAVETNWVLALDANTNAVPTNALNISSLRLSAGAIITGNITNEALNNNELVATAATSKGLVSISVDPPFSITGGSLVFAQADTDTDGYLSSTDWDTFNGKLDSSSSLTAAQVTNALPAILTNSVAQTAVGATIGTANGANLTNLTYLIRTNALNTGVITVGQTMITNVTGNITLGGFDGLTAGFENFAAVLVIPSGADRSVALPANVFSCDSESTYYATNGQALKLQFSIVPGVWTNCAAVHSW